MCGYVYKGGGGEGVCVGMYIRGGGCLGVVVPVVVALVVVGTVAAAVAAI